MVIFSKILAWWIIEETIIRKPITHTSWNTPYILTHFQASACPRPGTGSLVLCRISSRLHTLTFRAPECLRNTHNSQGRGWSQGTHERMKEKAIEKKRERESLQLSRIPVILYHCGAVSWYQPYQVGESCIKMWDNHETLEDFFKKTKKQNFPSFTCSVKS